MGPTSIAQADDLLPPQEVQFLWHNGAQAVSCPKAATAVQAKPKYLRNSNTRNLRMQIYFSQLIYRKTIFKAPHLIAMCDVDGFIRRGPKHTGLFDCGCLLSAQQREQGPLADVHHGSRRTPSLGRAGQG